MLRNGQVGASGQLIWDAEGISLCHRGNKLAGACYYLFLFRVYSGKGGKLLALQFRQEKLGGNCTGQEMGSQRWQDLHEDLENEQDLERMAVFGFLA